MEVEKFVISPCQLPRLLNTNLQAEDKIFFFLKEKERKKVLNFWFISNLFYPGPQHVNCFLTILRKIYYTKSTDSNTSSLPDTQIDNVYFRQTMDNTSRYITVYNLKICLVLYFVHHYSSLFSVDSLELDHISEKRKYQSIRVCQD